MVGTYIARTYITLSPAIILRLRSIHISLHTDKKVNIGFDTRSASCHCRLSGAWIDIFIRQWTRPKRISLGTKSKNTRGTICHYTRESSGVFLICHGLRSLPRASIVKQYFVYKNIFRYQRLFQARFYPTTNNSLLFL